MDVGRGLSEHFQISRTCLLKLYWYTHRHDKHITRHTADVFGLMRRCFTIFSVETFHYLRFEIWLKFDILFHYHSEGSCEAALLPRNQVTYTVCYVRDNIQWSLGMKILRWSEGRSDPPGGLFWNNNIIHLNTATNQVYCEHISWQTWQTVKPRHPVSWGCSFLDQIRTLTIIHVRAITFVRWVSLTVHSSYKHLCL